MSAAMAGLVLLSHQQEAGALPDSLQVIKKSLDSIGNAELLIFGVFKRNLVLATAWSVTLWGCSWRQAINRHQNSLFLQCLLGG